MCSLALELESYRTMEPGASGRTNPSLAEAYGRLLTHVLYYQTVRGLIQAEKGVLLKDC